MLGKERTEADFQFRMVDLKKEKEGLLAEMQEIRKRMQEEAEMS